MGKYYDKNNRRLVYTGHKSDSNFWDDHWEIGDYKSYIESNMRYNYVSAITKRFLPAGSNILEGGCGLGSNVAALQYRGYNAYGVDYANKTISKVNKLFPELKVLFGDVTKLDFEDNFFDGYWSLGVIEHFYDGFEPVVREMLRVLKPGGFAFITCPVLSPLRRLKACLRKYPSYHSEETDGSDFYQFALNSKYVTDVFSANGFKQVKVSGYDGVKGLKDEIALLRPLLQPLYVSKFLPLRVFKKLLDIPLRNVSGHCSLFIFKKYENVN